MKWIELAKERPTIGRMGQTDVLLIAYFPGPDTVLVPALARYDENGKGSGWFEVKTFDHLPAPRYWMPIDVPLR